MSYEVLGLGAPATPTPTSSHWGVITAGDVIAEQGRTLESAQGTDVAVQACTGLDPTVKTQWETFYAALTVWCKTPMINVWTPWAPSNAVVVTGDTGNTMMAWEASLLGWQQRLDGLCKNVVTLPQLNPKDPSSDGNQTLRYVAVAVGVVATAYVVGKVAEFLPRPSPKKKENG